MWASPPTEVEEGFCYRCRGRCPHRPECKKYMPDILHCQRQRRQRGDNAKLRHRPIKSKILRFDRQGSPETIGFWRAFGYFSRAGKVTRWRTDTPMQPPMPNRSKIPSLTSRTDRSGNDTPGSRGTARPRRGRPHPRASRGHPPPHTAASDQKSSRPRTLRSPADP